MIRPITVICWVLALGAGLYLYRAKHDVELIDQRIDQIARQTADLRSQSRRLLDDWIRLGEPEQLHKYSDEYLGLRTIAPGQFARLADLPSRLPAPEADPPAEQPETVAQPPDGRSPDAVATAVPSASAEPAAADIDRVDEATADELPIPPIPPLTPPVTSISFPAVTAVPLQARPVTPRLATGQSDQERPRSATAPRVAEEPRSAPAKATPMPQADPRQNATVSAPGGTAEPATAPVADAREPGVGAPVAARPGWQQPPRGMPPLQAQGARTVQSLPSSRAQAPGPAIAQSGIAQGGAGQGGAGQSGNGQVTERGPFLGPTSGHVSAQPGYRPAEPRVADVRPTNARQDDRAMSPRQAQVPLRPQPQPPLQAQTMERGPMPPVARQSPAQTPAPVAATGGSLLGGSRGPVPLPLPAPMPVSATWPPSGPLSAPTR